MAQAAIWAGCPGMAAARPYDVDPEKEEGNRHRHDGLTFDDGYRVLCQPPERQLVVYDRRRDYGEERWTVIGPDRDFPHVLLHVTYTERGDRLRLISVRHATPAERRRHADRHRTSS